MGTPLEVQRTARSVCLCPNTALYSYLKLLGPPTPVPTGPHSPQSRPSQMSSWSSDLVSFIRATEEITSSWLEVEKTTGQS